MQAILDSWECFDAFAEDSEDTIQRTPRNILPELISGRVEISFSEMERRRAGNFSTTSLLVARVEFLGGLG